MQNLIYSSSSEEAQGHTSLLLVLDQEIDSLLKETAALPPKPVPARGSSPLVKKLKNDPSRNNSRRLNSPLISSHTVKRSKINHSSTMQTPPQQVSRTELNKSATTAVSLSAFKPPSFKKSRSQRLLPPLSAKKATRIFLEEFPIPSDSDLLSGEEIKVSDTRETIEDLLTGIGLENEKVNSLLKLMAEMQDLSQFEKEKVCEVLFAGNQK